MLLYLCSPVTVAELGQAPGPMSNPRSLRYSPPSSASQSIRRIGLRAGDYLGQYSKSHHVELGDALIAATASIHNLQLWTRNRRHYPMGDLVFY